MFWGLIVQPNRKYATTVTTPFHISQAVLEVNATWSRLDFRPVQLILNVDQVDYILCSLNKTDRVQVPLDLNFSEGDEISLRCTADGTIHLTGYYVDEYELERTSLITSDSMDTGHSAESPPNDETTSSTGEGMIGVEPPVQTPRTPTSRTPTPRTPTPKPSGTNDGIVIAEIVKGNGTEATMGKKVQIFYERYKSLNASSEEGFVKIFSFNIGEGSVTKRWMNRVEGMRVGGKRKIFCSAQKAIGNIGPEPAKSYIVELLNVL